MTGVTTAPNALTILTKWSYSSDSWETDSGTHYPRPLFLPSFEIEDDLGVLVPSGGSTKPQINPCEWQFKLFRILSADCIVEFHQL